MWLIAVVACTFMRVVSYNPQYANTQERLCDLYRDEEDRPDRPGGDSEVARVEAGRGQDQQLSATPCGLGVGLREGARFKKLRNYGASEERQVCT